ncbi:hypothetical protein Kpol_1062p40 [Vanderwaltozyma polyspora DSM 70294]|uniref:ethanolamine-phosphate cytidylyltransferase n=1 Tax=Vanderwaltozyma polyspora (strain ATCC 22028 / DSM 70294 / BCRC 21397 / CBS 2163 / NBRC 10782 / NRRL Y-8283 / UCD 57-17) TaxID=436907 RepID=A7TK96_VANPO|nr:uncharacterized protein Kpol_1062p40 [Vanderwaltozyma polyspora DSM 70294]EDO17331.1 hypothetical protein Kpol_1062p40 [Vanderwaltozyma polyspora DSM 70294]
MTIALDDNKVWIDGCFDFTHHGHCGAILQARQTIRNEKNSNGKLYCGVHNDEEIEYNKDAKPVMNSLERYEHTRSNRWCDEVIESAPYVTSQEVMDQYGCKYVVHGDDITLTATGEDCYQKMKDLNRFREVKRTKNVSTTDIIDRILNPNKYLEFNILEEPTLEELEQFGRDKTGHLPYCYVFKTSIDEENIILKGGYELNKNKIVICEGDFDLFNVSDIERLRLLKDQNPKETKIIVSINVREDKTHYMSLKERMLSIMSCKYVDGILINDDKRKYQEITRYNINDIGCDSDDNNCKKFNYLTKELIVERINDQRERYIKRNIKKGIVN